MDQQLAKTFMLVLNSLKGGRMMSSMGEWLGMKQNFARSPSAGMGSWLSTAFFKGGGVL